MATAQATEARLDAVKSHSVTLAHPRGEVSKEECFPVVRAEWRGQEITCELELSRYVHSSGWSDWRCFIHRTDPHVTETATKALATACTPLARQWLNTDDYAVSRREAYFHMVRRELRETRYNADTPGELVEKWAHELSEHDLVTLTVLANLTRDMILTLAIESVPE